MEHFIIDYITDSDRAYINMTGAAFLNRNTYRRFSANTKDDFIQCLQNLNTDTNDLCLTILSHGHTNQQLRTAGVINDDQRINLIEWRKLLDICNQIRTENRLILNVLHPCNSYHIMDNHNKEDRVDCIWYSPTENATVNHALRSALEFSDLSSFIADVSQDEDVDYIEYKG